MLGGRRPTKVRKEGPFGALLDSVTKKQPVRPSRVIKHNHHKSGGCPVGHCYNATGEIQMTFSELRQRGLTTIGKSDAKTT